MRVMVLGDTHGDSKWAVEVTRIAAEHGAKRILQVGDFGYWPRMNLTPYATHAEWFLGEIDWACDDYGLVEWIVIDGNHDDHQSLAELDGQPDNDGMRRLSRRVRYSPRGNIFKLEDTVIGTLGGAASIDAYLEDAGLTLEHPEPYRRGWDWFPELEQPTQDIVEGLSTRVDLLLTHEAPIEVDLSHLNGFPGVYISPEIQRLVDRPRLIVSSMVCATEPKLLIHGHWHGRNRAFIEHAQCEVVGLASTSRHRGRDERAFVFLDLPDLTVKALSFVSEGVGQDGI